MGFAKITYIVYKVRRLNESGSARDASYFIAVITRELLASPRLHELMLGRPFKMRDTT